MTHPLNQIGTSCTVSHIRHNIVPILGKNGSPLDCLYLVLVDRYILHQESGEHVSVHRQQDKFQLCVNGFMRWMTAANPPGPGASQTPPPPTIASSVLTTRPWPIKLHIHFSTNNFVMFIPLSVVQFAVAISDTRYDNVDAASDGQMLYKSSITAASTDWASYDVSIPDGHSGRYIYAYLMEVRASSNDPYINIIEIEAYPPFTYGKSWLGYIDKYRQTSKTSRKTSTKLKMFLVSSCSCNCPNNWSHVLSRQWRCSWGGADRRCSNYILVINNFISY